MIQNVENSATMTSGSAPGHWAFLVDFKDECCCDEEDGPWKESP
jgi:hypothetical protein